MKSKRKDTIKQRVTSRFKGLGAIMLSLFMILTGMSLMPPVEAEAATGDQYWIIGYNWYDEALFCTGQESSDISGHVYDVLSWEKNHEDNGYVKEYSGFQLSSGSSLTSLGTLSRSGMEITISPEEATYVNAGCVNSKEDNGMLFQMKVDGTVKAETTGLGEEGKAKFLLDAGKYAVKCSDEQLEGTSIEHKLIVDFKSVIDSLTVTPADATLTFGGSTRTLTVSPASAADKVKWSSEDTEIATVDSDGTVTPVSAGTVTIKATYTPEEGDPIVGTCKVTVNKAESTVAKIPTAKNLTYNGKAQELVIAGTADGGTMQYALGTKDAATEEYTTSIPTATDAGTYYVWYKAKGDENHYDSDAKAIEVRISEAVTPSIAFDTPSMSLKIGEGKSITVTVVPEDAKVTWTSDKEAVATVDANGTVKAVSEGTATITGKITVDGNDYSAECKVTVAAGQTEYLVVPEDLSDDNISSEIIERYGTVTEVKAVIKEAAGVAPEQTGNYELYDAQITVIENGVSRPATAADITSEGLEAIFPYPEGSNQNQVFAGVHMIGEDSGEFKAGDIEQLTFTNEDDGLHARVHGLSPVIITWKEPTPTDTGVTLNLSETFLSQGMEKALKATTVPAGAAITWTSSDTKIAYVDGNGVVMGLKPGTATITAKITVDGKEYSASYKVTVVPAGTPIIIQSGGGEHTHKFVWNTIEATEDTDGELRYQCETCGEIQTRVPLTAYNVFNKNTTEKIRKAPKDATVRIETNKWISFHKMVMEALAERKDVTLEISFLDGEYKGNRCTVVIPKGTDTTTLVDKNGFTGFLFLGGKFGMKTN